MLFLTTGVLFELLFCCFRFMELLDWMRMFEVALFCWSNLESTFPLFSGVTAFYTYAFAF